RQPEQPGADAARARPGAGRRGGPAAHAALRGRPAGPREDPRARGRAAVAGRAAGPLRADAARRLRAPRRQALALAAAAGDPDLHAAGSHRGHALAELEGAGLRPRWPAARGLGPARLLLLAARTLAVAPGLLPAQRAGGPAAARGGPAGPRGSARHAR